MSIKATASETRIAELELLVRQFVEMYEHDDESWMSTCEHPDDVREARRSTIDIVSEARVCLSDAQLCGTDCVR